MAVEAKNAPTPHMYEMRNHLKDIFSEKDNLITDLVLSYLFVLPNSSKPLPVTKEIEVHYGSDGRPYFSKLGRTLTEQDVGKKMVRAAPHDGDWSYIPTSKQLGEIKRTSLKILEVRPTHIMVYHFALKELILESEWNNEWCTAREFFNAVQKHTKLKPLPLPPKEIEVVYGTYDRVAFLGLGRALTQQDVGKKMVRAAPLEGDWSYVPTFKKLKEIESESCLILEVKPTHTKIKFCAYDEEFFMKPKWNSDWCTAREFFEAIEKYTEAKQR